MAPMEYRAVVLMAIVSVPTCAYYLPGVSPVEYKEGSEVDLKVNKLTSVKTQLPYAYYTLPYCKPQQITDSVENLGEILAGDLIENSPYEIKMLVNTECKVLCKQALDQEKKDKFRSMIDDEYLVNWMVDNLPAATRFVRTGAGGGEFTYMDGFPVGVEQQGRYFIHNHVKLDLKYHRQPDEFEGYRIVGFEVEPHSMTQATRPDGNAEGSFTAMCQEGVAAPAFDIDLHQEIVFTYDVIWNESPIRWSTRWDNYLKMAGGQIHWFAILNSLVIVLFLSGMVAMILLRTLHRDISKYNESFNIAEMTAEEAAEESGWKLVHGDVFRPPAYANIFAVVLGSGMQIIAMSVITMVFAAFGFLSPEHRGALL